MLAKLLGIIDIIASIVILMSGLMPAKVIIVFGIYLMIKGALFNILGFNIISVIDFAIGAFILLGVYAGFSITFFRIVFFVFLIQKGIFSLF